MRLSAASNTGSSVESMTSGAWTAVASRRTSSSMSRTSSRPTKAVHTSMAWEPPFTWVLPMPTMPSQSCASRRRLNWRLPLAFVRSPTAKMSACWRSGAVP